MAEEVFVEGRKPGVKRGLDEKAIEAGVDLNSIRVVKDGYMVPAELAPKKSAPKRKSAEKADEKSDAPEGAKSDADEGEN